VENQHDNTRRFVALIGAYDRKLFAYVLALVPNFADAEELTQQVRLRLWQQFDEYDPQKDFGAWAKTIAYYLILAHRKSSMQRRIQFSTEAVEAIALEVNRQTDRDDDRNWAMQECLGKMDESKRRLLMHYYSTGNTLREIAAEVGRSFDAVRHSILRTRMVLADCVQRVMRREEVR
jgi:RNA polymerase sigma-70 factor (ECF subfamily)